MHEAQHVRDLIEANTADGFGNKSKKDNKAIRMTVGNFLAAAEWCAAGYHPGVVWSLTSGFHHARHSSAGAFCTFNALNLSAWELWKFRGMRSLIIDGDAHYGDGCIDIIRKMEQQPYLTYLQSNYDHLFGVWNPVRYARQIAEAIAEVDLVMYQAGADAWEDDPFGAGMLSIEQLKTRDRITMQAAKDAGKPIVVNLAGGYSDMVLDIHLNTAEAMKEVFL